MNHRKKLSNTLLLGCALFLVIFGAGCAGTTTQTTLFPKPTPEEIFDAAIDGLIENLFAQQAHTSREIAPVAVMSGSLKTGSKFTRLEEHIMDQLSLKLREQHDIYTFSRQNWFEYREGRPLTFNNLSVAEQNHLRNLMIYEVRVSAEKSLNEMVVNIVAADAEGRSVAGTVAGTQLHFNPEDPAYQLYHAAPNRNPFPEGLEERPYESIDRLNYSLSAELTDVYRTGILVDTQVAAKTETRVILYAKPSGNIAPGIVRAIQDGLQQAIVSRRGFTCAVSKEDFGPAFHRIDFYRKHKSIFEFEESKFAAGTVLLMADISKHPDGEKIGVALRAIWRIGPLESDSGDLIPTNVSGTYLSGFTSKAYLSADSIKIPYSEPKTARSTLSSGLAKTEKTKVEHPKTEPEQPTSEVKEYIRDMPVRDMEVCFYQFPEVYEKRIYSVLNEAQGVTDIRPANDLCSQEGSCLCYVLAYQGTRQMLRHYLQKNLRTSNALTYKIKPKGKGRLEVHFHGGFE